MAMYMLLLVHVYFTEISAVSNSLSTIDISVTTPIVAPSTTTLFSVMVTTTIQPSSTTSSLDLLQISTEALPEQLTPITTTYSAMLSTTVTLPSEFEVSTMTRLMTTASTSLGPSITTDGPTPTKLPPIAPPDTLTTTDSEATTTNTNDSDTEDEPTLLPISAEILALIAVGLSAASFCCVIVFSLGCVVILACRGRKKSRTQEIQDSAFRSATLQRPLGIAIRETFPIAVENPTFSDHSPDMELKNLPTTNYKSRKVSNVSVYS